MLPFLTAKEALGDNRGGPVVLVSVQREVRIQL